MANYIASARSNYFKVKDLDKFVAWLNTVPDVSLIKDGKGRVGFMNDQGENGELPCWRYDEETDDHVEIDLLGELAPHLCEGEVAILVEAGAEKLRYICGCALAVNHEGETLGLHLSDIYRLVEKTWGVKPIAAEY